MPKVFFTEPDGTRREVSAPAGISLMEAAVGNRVQGIVALCGGACACATCHVYVAESWLPRLAAREEMEEGMLESAFGVKDNSRLSCQISLSDQLDGLEVTVPAQQGL